MAIYHMKISPVSRSSGHSATAKIVYNTREKITDLRTGEVHKYSSEKMRADLVHSEITCSKDVIENKHRSEIWNNAELAENRSNSRTAREYVLALPKELTNEQNIQLVREFAQELTTKYSNVADWAIHNERDGNGNIHAHILTTTRKFDIETNQLSSKTDLELDNGSLKKQGKLISQDQIKEIRKDWETIQNHHLEIAGIDKKVSCAIQENRDLVKLHLGKEATALERKGIKTELGDYNRNIDAPIYLQEQIFYDEKNLLTAQSELAQMKLQEQQEIERIAKYQEQLNLELQEKEKIRLYELRRLKENGISSENSLTSANYDQSFDITKEYGSMFVKCGNDDYSYYVNHDISIEVHKTHINILQSSDEHIKLALDIAIIQFGENLEINGNDRFVRSVIEALAKDHKYDDVNLSKHEQNIELETERFIQRAEILNPDKMIQEEIDKEVHRLIENASLIDYEKILRDEALKQQKLERDSFHKRGHDRGMSM